MVAEGTRGNVSSMIQAVLRKMAPLVTDHSETWSPETGEFADFQIHTNET